MSTPDACSRRVLWERLDEPGWESACLEQVPRGWEIDARFVGVHEGEAVSADYRLVLDERWVTLRLEASWGLGPLKQTLTLDRVGTRWRVNGTPRADLDGCIDVDLRWTPFTNTLPIRRLALAANTPHELEVAWIDAGTLAVHKSLQRYTRLDASTVRFESLRSGFRAELQVDGDGLVTAYPGLFRRLVG